VWADQHLNQIHIIQSYRGHVILNFLWPQDAKHGATLGHVDPAFAALWTGYRKALANGTATRAGEREAFGHHVYWLRFRAAGSSRGSEVAVDAHTYKPIVYRSYSGVQPIDEHLLLAETTAYNAGDFTRHGPNPMLGPYSVGSSTGTSASGLGFSKPSTTVPRGWLTAGPDADGHPLAAVTAQTVTAGKRVIHSYELVYGPVSQGVADPGATTIDELPRPDVPSLWAQIPPGHIQIDEGQTGGPGRNHLVWTGYLISHARYVTITTQHGEAPLLAIARSLRQVK